ncbi:MFS transporter [Acinetobacter sp. ANC 3882]|uniref:MFS transporter n=1 Tax=Acinetobacter sp. ANC 3882 TaxID=2923423 RepID=UPI001F4ACC96|nr:MFS transporter [Acinetobacter sp. ANC 3882]MCH7313185.1 MFS transporter [Acinetobacter sp. ANC 3882]
MKEVALNDLIDQQVIGRYQKFILFTCLLLMIMDGYDIQAMAYAAPMIIGEWGVEKTMLGVVFSASLFGLFVGSFVLSSLSDRLGRRPILLISTLVFSVLMLATPHVSNIEQLATIRFVTGIFLGGIMPNAMAYSSEIVPHKYRILTMMVISCGYTVGAMLGGGISALLTPLGGWQAIFYFGGIIPLIIFFIMLFKLPESLYFLGENKNNEKTIVFWLKKFYPTLALSPATKIIGSTGPKIKKSPLELFKNKRAFFTYSIWVISILNMISLYFLANWLPTLSKEAGLSLNQALMIGSTLQLGGTIGTIVMGLKIDKIGFYKVLIPVFIVAVVSVALIGYSVSHIVLLFMVVFIAGFAIVGGQPAINALSASYYPVSLRTTGVGWSIGIARLGSVIGPLFGGYLAKSLLISHLFVIAAIPSLCVIVMLMVQAKYKQSA